MNASFFGLAFPAAANPKLPGVDLLLIQNARPRLMFSGSLPGCVPGDRLPGRVRPACRCHQTDLNGQGEHARCHGTQPTRMVLYRTACGLTVAPVVIMSVRIAVMPGLVALADFTVALPDVRSPGRIRPTTIN